MSEKMLKNQQSKLFDPLLTLADVIAAIHFSRQHIYLMIKQGKFPAPIKLGLKSIAWRLSVIEKWVKDREEGGVK